MQLHQILPTESFDALKDHVAEIVIGSIMGVFDTKVTRLRILPGSPMYHKGYLSIKQFLQRQN